MTTKTRIRKATENKQSSLTRRIRQFYALLNHGKLDQCFKMIDPHVREKPSSVTLLQYENSLRLFLNCVGSLRILEIQTDLHLNEPSKLYEGRDFALGTTTWMDEVGNQGAFSERWVWDGRSWFTRSTGFVVPAVVNAPKPNGKLAKTKSGT